jgi:hypothetical protein
VYYDMASVLDILAEQRIIDALQRGELDNLPSAGKPLDIENQPFVSGEQRMLNQILKNAGCVPAEVSLRKEIFSLRKEIDAQPEGEVRQTLKRDLVLKLIRLNHKY